MGSATEISDVEPRVSSSTWFFGIVARLVLVGLAILPFAGALHNEMIGDDSLIVAHRIQVATASDLVSLLTENYWGDLETRTRLYRPVTLIALGVQKLLFGEDYWPFRVFSMFLHACCVVIVFELTRVVLSRFVQPVSSNSFWPAWCAAAIFAVHPIHAEAVITLYGQSDLLAALFGLASLWIFLGFGNRSRISIALSMVCYMLSLGAKESGVLIPLVAILMRHLRSSDSLRPTSWISNLRISDASWIVAFVAYLGARVYVLGGDLAPSGEGSVAMGYPVSGRIKLAIVTIGEYVRMLWLPWGQTIYYGHLRDAIFGLPWWQCTVLIVSYFGMRELFAVDRRAGVLITGTFALLLFPVANVIPIGTFVAERAIYLPSVSLAFMVAWLLQRNAAYLNSKPVKQVAMISFALLLMAAAAAAWNTAYHWREPLSLWRHTADCHPRSPKAQALTAIYLLEDVSTDSASVDQLDEARQRLELAEQLNPNARLTVQGLEMLRKVEEARSRESRSGP